MIPGSVELCSVDVDFNFDVYMSCELQSGRASAVVLGSRAATQLEGDCDGRGNGRRRLQD